MKKKTLSKKEIKELNEKIARYGFQFDKKDNVEMFEGEWKVIKKDGDILFFYLEGEIYPTLKLVLRNDVRMKKVVVDMGAVKFVVNGADIMRPGIVGIDMEVEKDEIIIIVDANNEKPLAIGRALFGGKEIDMMISGKVLKNLHYVGDELWNL
jgi:PUA domain protein